MIPAFVAATALPSNAFGGSRRERLARLSQRVGLLPLLAGFRALTHADVRILAYHRVLDLPDGREFLFDPEEISASSDAFRAQMRLVRRRYQPMRFDEMLDCVERGRALPRNAVLITFDDGYEDNHRVAFPILRDLGMSAMFFVSTGHIDSGAPFAYDWLVHMLCVTGADALDAPELGARWPLPATLDERRALGRTVLDRLKLQSAPLQQAFIERLERDWSMPRAQAHPDCLPMDWKQLREMRAGGMELGSHGVTHRMLGSLPHAEMVAEVHESKAALERELDMRVDVISYPVGSPDAYGDAVIDEVRAAGYRMACSYVTGVSAVSDATRYAMLRLPVERMDDAWFEAMIAMPELFTYPHRRRIG
jgi:peptidoglycan/xylan/chitin deacetylase (PgdA/CDA1 family)